MQQYTDRGTDGGLTGTPAAAPYAIFSSSKSCGSNEFPFFFSTGDGFGDTGVYIYNLTGDGNSAKKKNAVNSSSRRKTA